MNNSEKAELMGLWAVVVESYNRKPPTDNTLKMVALQLEDYSLAEVKRAIKAHGIDRNNDGFPPTTNDIAKLIDGDGEGEGLKAFSKMLTAMGSVGAGQSICFDDAIINQVIQDMGGWIELCMSDEYELKKFKVHEFDKRYRSYMNRFPADYPRKLIGSEEAYNQMNWPNRKQPLRLIGDRAKAIAVHELPAPVQLASSTEYLPSSQPEFSALPSRRPPELQLIHGRLMQERDEAEQVEADNAEARNDLSAELDRKSKGGET